MRRDRPGFLGGRGPPGNRCDLRWLALARQAILDCIDQSCGTTLAEALGMQAEHSAGFMISPACRQGAIGAMYKKTMAV